MDDLRLVAVAQDEQPGRILPLPTKPRYSTTSRGRASQTASPVFHFVTAITVPHERLHI